MTNRNKIEVGAEEIMRWLVERFTEYGLNTPEERSEGRRDAGQIPLSPSIKGRLGADAPKNERFNTAATDFLGQPVSVFIQGVDTVFDLASKLIKVEEVKLSGVSRFAETPPTKAIEPAPVLPVVSEVKVVVPEGLTLNEAFLTPTEEAARNNLMLGLEELAGKGTIDQATKERVLYIFDGVVSASIMTAENKDPVFAFNGSLSLMARHPVEGRKWASNLLNVNKGQDGGVMAGEIIIPRATSHGYLYEEKAPQAEEGTSLASSPLGSFKNARVKMGELKALFGRYPEISSWLAKAKPGLFGNETIERLEARFDVLREINDAPPANRGLYFSNAVRDGLIPMVEASAKEENEDEIDSLKREGEHWSEVRTNPKFAGAAEILEEEYRQKIAPAQRRLDLHSAALARDAAVIIDTFKMVGGKAEEERQGFLDKLPDLEGLEKMWAPTGEGAESPNRLQVYKSAGLSLAEASDAMLKTEELTAGLGRAVRTEDEQEAAGIYSRVFKKAPAGSIHSAMALIGLARCVMSEPDRAFKLLSSARDSLCRLALNGEMDVEAATNIITSINQRLEAYVTLEIVKKVPEGGVALSGNGPIQKAMASHNATIKILKGMQIISELFDDDKPREALKLYDELFERLSSSRNELKEYTNMHERLAYSYLTHIMLFESWRDENPNEWKIEDSSLVQSGYQRVLKAIRELNNGERVGKWNGLIADFIKHRNTADMETSSNIFCKVARSMFSKNMSFTKILREGFEPVLELGTKALLKRGK